MINHNPLPNRTKITVSKNPGVASSAVSAMKTVIVQLEVKLVLIAVVFIIFLECVQEKDQAIKISSNEIREQEKLNFSRNHLKMNRLN